MHHPCLQELGLEEKRFVDPDLEYRDGDITDNIPGVRRVTVCLGLFMIGN